MDLSRRYSFFKLIKQPRETYESMGPFTSYYLSIFDRHGDKPWFLSWNWVAFVSSFWGAEILWLLYRRMYVNALAVSMLRSVYALLALKVIGVAGSIGGPILARSIYWVSHFAFVFGFTVIANALYFQFLGKKIAQRVEKKGVDIVVPLLLLGFYFYYLPQFFEKNPKALTLLRSVLEAMG